MICTSNLRSKRKKERKRREKSKKIKNDKNHEKADQRILWSDFKYFTHASIFIFIYSQWQRIIPRAFRFLSNTFVAARLPLLLQHEFFAEAFYMALDDPSAVTVG